MSKTRTRPSDTGAGCWVALQSLVFKAFPLSKITLAIGSLGQGRMVVSPMGLLPQPVANQGFAALLSLVESRRPSKGLSKGISSRYQGAGEVSR